MIQAIIFEKIKFTKEEAKKKFEKMDFKLLKGKKIHETERYWRFRVSDPKKNKQYRTIAIKPGIKAIYAI